ncbi:MAG TPA: AAA family ATPase [Candidatus Dormibacteraeota bacterium]|nr:AAA family ATPase [Candidatus Dormibacteraeota bacterium]
MYKSFFGLKKNPFNANPDPHYLCLTPQMKQSLDELTYGIETRQGLMLLTGEVGTGKTTLMNHLLTWLHHERVRTAFIFNSHLDSKQLFEFILSDFEIQASSRLSSSPQLVFKEWLLERHRAHELVVLIVDEAQGLAIHVLEQIRLLFDMDTPREKLLQIVLCGQPELEAKLQRPELRQLQQHITLRCKTAPLSSKETHFYIQDRLRIAGAKNAQVFTPEAMDAVYFYSRGIPRVVNLLCENALISAYVDQLRPIPTPTVEEAARDLQFDDVRPFLKRLDSIGDKTISSDTLQTLLEIAHMNSAAFNEIPLEQQTYTAKKDIPYLVPRPSPEECFNVENDPYPLPLDREALAEPPDVSAGSELLSLDVVKLDTEEESTAETIGTVSPTAQKIALTSVDVIQLAPSPVVFAVKPSETVNPMADCPPSAPRSISRSVPPRRNTKSVRAQAGARRNSILAWSKWLDRWWSRNFNPDVYGMVFYATGSIGIVLFVLSTVMRATGPWQRFEQILSGYFGLVLCAVSIGFGVTMVIHDRATLAKRWSMLTAESRRWLNEPIRAIQLHGLTLIPGKMYPQRPQKRT